MDTGAQLSRHNLGKPVFVQLAVAIVVAMRLPIAPNSYRNAVFAKSYSITQMGHDFRNHAGA